MSKDDLETLLMDVEEIISYMWQEGYNNKRDARNNFKAMMKDENDPLVDAVMDKLTDEYDYDTDDFSEDEYNAVIDKIKAACQDCLDNH